MMRPVLASGHQETALISIGKRNMQQKKLVTHALLFCGVLGSLQAIIAMVWFPGLLLVPA